MNVKKRLLALLLVFSMVFSMFPVNGFAVETEEDLESLAESGITAPHMENKPENGTTNSQPFAAGTGGSANFRIPGIVTLDDGTLVAVCDARWNHSADSSGLDTIVSVSKDNGETWKYTFANYFGDNGNVFNSYSSCIIDPAIATDGTTVYLIADLFPAGMAINTSAYRAQSGSTGYTAEGYLALRSDAENGLTFGNSGYDSAAAAATYGYYLKDGKIYTTAGAEVEGYTVDAYFNITGTDGTNTNLFFGDSPYKPFPTDYLYMTTSTDGLNWSEPTLINLKAADEQTLLIGPGNGTYDPTTGRMIFTAYEYDWGTQNACLVWRETDGTWHRSENAASSSHWTSEASSVVLDNGTVRIFYRDGYTNLFYSDYVYSEAQGNYVVSNREVSTSAVKASNNQLTSIRYSEPVNGKDAILVACSASGSGSRVNGHLYVFTLNEDNTMELAYDYDIFPGENEYYAYNCISEMNDGNIALLYENASAAITYHVIDMSKVLARENDPQLTFKEAELLVGETVTFTDNSGYYGEADTSELDTEVAKLTMAGEETVTNAAQLGSNTSYNGDTIDLADCLYTFSANSDGTWVATSTDAEGNTVYLYPGHTASSGYPNAASTDVPLQIFEGYEENTFHLYNATSDNTNGSASYLYFDRSGLCWDRVSSFNDREDWKINCSLMLYKPVEGDGSAEIPGYERVTELGAITDGEYLVVAPGTDGSLYALYPNTSTANRYCQIAKLLGRTTVNSTELTFTGLAAGNTEVQVGSVVYRITVSDANVVPVEMTVGSTVSVIEPNGNYAAEVDTDALNTSVATVTVTGVDGTADNGLSTAPVSTLTDGTYVILNTRASKLVTNAPASAAAAAGAGSGLNMSGSKTGEIEKSAVWTITKVDGGYTAQDADGNYMTIGSTTAGVTSNAATLALNHNGDTWTIAQNGAYLNHFGGGSSTCAAGWESSSAAGDPGSQFEIYAYSEEAHGASTQLTFTAEGVGETELQVGSTIYRITVSESETPPVTTTDRTVNLYNKTTSYYFDESSVDAAGTYSDAVASVIWTPVEYKVQVAQCIANGSTFDLDACLYDFTLTEDGFIVSSASEENIYLNILANSAGYPQANTFAYIHVSGVDGSYYITEGESNLYFEGRWDRWIGTHDNCNMLLYRPVREGEVSSSELPGFIQVKVSADEITEGQYLIVAKKSDVYYVMYPSVSTTNYSAHVAYVSDPVSTVTKTRTGTEVIVNALSVGDTSVQIGNVDYTINVFGLQEETIDVDIHVGGTLHFPAYDSTVEMISGADNANVVIQRNYVTITGLAAGTAQAKVGHIVYNINVIAQYRDIYLSVGGTNTLVVSGIQNLADLDTSIANVEFNSTNDYMYVTGVTVGNTSVIVGDVIYRIFVEPADMKEETIIVYKGRTVEVVDPTADYYSSGNYDMSNVVDDIATITNLSGGIGTFPYEVDEIISGRQYHIVTSLDGRLLTNDSRDNGLFLDGFITDSEHPSNSVWTIEENEDGTYKIYHVDGNYLEIGNATASTSGTGNLTIERDGGLWTIGDNKTGTTYYLNQFGGKGYTLAKGWTDIDGGSRWYLYMTNYGQTSFTVTGVAVGTYEGVRIGNTKYTIIVKDLPEDGFVDLSNTPFVSKQGQADGKAFTKLTLSQGVSYNFALDLSDFSGVTNYSVSFNGKELSATDGVYTIPAQSVAADTTYELVAIINEVEHKIPVLITNDAASTSYKYYNLYIDEIQDTVVNYSWNCSTTFTEAIEGEVIYRRFPADTLVALDFFGTPYDDYALTFMSATGSNGDYLSLFSENGEAEKTEWVTTSGAAGAIQYQLFRDALIDMTQAAMDNLKADGAQGFTRPTGDGSSVNTSLTFRSQRLLGNLQKEIIGVLGNLRNASSFRYYENGMYASVGEYIFYKISLEKYDEDVNIIYTDVFLTDMLDGAYFIVASGKDPVTGNGYFHPDQENIITGNGYSYTVDNNYINADYPNQTMTASRRKDLTKLVEATSKAESYEFYVVYQIQASDINPDETINNIQNDVELTYKYRAEYSAGTSTKDDSATANMQVVGQSMPDYVVDFGMPLTITLTVKEHLDKPISEENINNAVNGARFGNVTCVKNDSDNTWTLTYTPDQIIRGYDVIYIMDEGNNYVNHFRVFPATTVYYDNTFLTFEDSSKWQNVSGTEVKAQTAHAIGANTVDGAIFNPYGYDANVENTGTYAVTNQMNSSASFTFNGTGFDLYANCAGEDTGYAAVDVKNASGSIVKLYFVNTVVKNGESQYTTYPENLNSMAIVSNRDLDYGTYEVNIRKVKDTKDIRIDGFRIYNTINDSSMYNDDLEDNPSFIELRDAVLCGLGIGEITDTSNPAKLVEQVYNFTNGSNATNGPNAIITDENYPYFGSKDDEENTLQDLLNNGPKNELFLYPGQSLSFAVSTNRLIQLGMKVPANAAVNYKISVAYGQDQPLVITDELKDATDMFYALNRDLIGTERDYVVTVKNESEDTEDILSVTTLKICDDPNAVLKEMDQSDIASMLHSLGIIDDVDFDQPDNIDPTEPEESKPTDSIAPSEPEESKPTDSVAPSEPEESNPTDPAEPSEPVEDEFDPDQVKLPFTDIQKGTWFYEGVAYVYHHKLMNGMKTDLFAPDAAMTRAMVVTVLYRLEGSPSTDYDAKYSDVPADAYFTDAVNWATENGVVFGVGNNRFAPDSDVTREQLATMLYRYCQMKKYDVEAEDNLKDFPDFDQVTVWSKDGMKWAVNKGLINGVKNGSSVELKPSSNALRSQIAVILQRFCELYK